MIHKINNYCLAFQKQIWNAVGEIPLLLSEKVIKKQEINTKPETQIFHTRMKMRPSSNTLNHGYMYLEKTHTDFLESVYETLDVFTFFDYSTTIIVLLEYKVVHRITFYGLQIFGKKIKYLLKEEEQTNPFFAWLFFHNLISTPERPISKPLQKISIATNSFFTPSHIVN